MGIITQTQKDTERLFVTMESEQEGLSKWNVTYWYQALMGVIFAFSHLHPGDQNTQIPLGNFPIEAGESITSVLFFLFFLFPSVAILIDIFCSYRDVLIGSCLVHLAWDLTYPFR